MSDDPYAFLDQGGGFQAVDDDPYAFLDKSIKTQDKITKDRETRERAEARVATERAGQTNLPSDIAWQFARGTLPGAYLDEGAAFLTSTVKGTPYDEELAYQRAANRAMDRESPVIGTLPYVGDVTVGGAAKLAGGVAGGLGTYGAARGLGGAAARFVAPGATPLRTAGKLAAGGAASGAIYGYGEGEGEGNRAANAALGAGIGAVTGPAAYAAGAGLARGYQGARNLMFGSRDEALRPYVKSATETVRRAIDADDAAMGRAAVDRTGQRLGPEGMLLDTGDATMGLGQGAIASSTPARGIVRGAVRDRARQSVGRLEQAATRAMGRGEDLANILKNEEQLAENAFGPAYKAFRDLPLTLSARTQGLVQRIDDAFPGLVERVQRNIANDPDLDPNVIRNGGHFLDQLRQTLSDAGYKKELPGLGALERGAVKNARAYAKRLNDAIDAEVKQAGAEGLYKTARAHFSDLAQFKDGVEAAKGMLNKADVSPGAIRQMLKGKPARFAEGVRTAAREDIRRAMQTARSVYGNEAADQSGASAALRMLSSSEARTKLRAMGFKASDIRDLLQVADREGRFLGTKASIMGGSQTAERQEARKMFPQVRDNEDYLRSLGSKTTMGAALEPAGRAFNRIFAGEINQQTMRQAEDIGRMLVAQGQNRDRIIAALRRVTDQKALDDTQKQMIGRLIARLARSVDDRALQADDRTGQFSPNRMLGN